MNVRSWSKEASELAFPPGAPLRRGGVYPLKAGGAELRSELYGAERRGAPLLPPLRSGRRPHISPLVAFRKKEGSYFLAWRAWSRDWRGEWPFNARGPGEHGRRHGGWVRGAAGTLQAAAMYDVRYTSQHIRTASFFAA